jgi:predicted RNA polymerase sigma factor
LELLARTQVRPPRLALLALSIAATDAFAQTTGRDLGIAEELAQDALVTALELWPAKGIPENPGAWLMTAAKPRPPDLLVPQCLHRIHPHGSARGNEARCEHNHAEQQSDGHKGQRIRAAHAQ